ncbi:MAG TPA: alpha/beta fold hydrolase [Pyrinomonadaceae bacterium]|jgi:dipeptidyl aminopeptidase/acylaminoacyl peptidase
MLLKSIRAIFFTILLCLAASAQNLSVRDIMAEPSIAGMRAESQRLSPDGKYVVYMWNAEGGEPKDVYIASTTGGEPRKLLSPKDLLPAISAPAAENKLNYGVVTNDDFTKARQNQIGNLDWSPDSKRILFAQNGDLYVLNIEENAAKPRRLTKTQSAEFAARFLDDNRILFSQNGNFFVVDTKDFSLIQISKEANPQAFVSVFNATPTEDGNLIAYLVSDASKQKTIFVPNYLDEFVQAPTTRRGFTEQKALVVKADGSVANPFEIKLPKAEGAGYIRSLRWAADNSSLVVDRVDKDLKRRQLFYIHDVGSKAEQTILVTEETDEKWIAPLSSIVETNPKNDAQILFGSEKDGFNHLYLATLERATPQANPTGEIRQENPSDAGFTSKIDIKQLTKGKWQVEWAKWMTDGKRFVFLSTEAGTATRNFYVGNESGYSQFFNFDKGMIASPQLSKTTQTGDVLLYEFSKWNYPGELFAFRNCVTCDSKLVQTQITRTTPNAFLQRKWNEPKFVDIPTRDGKQVKSKIYLPNAFDKKKKYPMVIFVHGAGYLQNTINGWNNYYREFMFNELLTEKGYVVLDIDYRGSAGYGRDWRTDVYDFLGGKDYDDHLDAIDFMTANYAVDKDKIGVYGGSYGGFMAEMLVLRAPERIAAAAALRPVADWKNYFYSSPIYTAERLGFPDKNAEAYKRSSPISYADKLQKPLLILHGLVDDNVPAQDSMQFVEKLIRLEKTPYFEAMFYPAESHGFARPTSWTDEYERILAFFEKNLK